MKLGDDGYPIDPSKRVRISDGAADRNVFAYFTNAAANGQAGQWLIVYSSTPGGRVSLVQGTSACPSR